MADQDNSAVEVAQESAIADVSDETNSVLSAVQTVIQPRPRHPAFQLLMLTLSVYVLITLSLDAFVLNDPEIRRVVQLIDLIICIIFFIDFWVLLIAAPDKREYMKWGWVDLVSSIPLIDPLRWGRVARIIRIIRILRALKSLRVIYDTVKASPLETLSVMTFLVVFFSFSVSASLILEFERGLESPIQTAGDAMWWAALSILNAKASYPMPQSPGGIITGVYLNKVGLLLFAYINGAVIAWLVNNRNSKGTTSQEN